MVLTPVERAINPHNKLCWKSIFLNELSTIAWHFFGRALRGLIVFHLFCLLSLPLLFYLFFFKKKGCNDRRITTLIAS